MSSWREKLLPASFRAVDFFIVSSEDAMGRRSIVHEFPDKLNPYVEDMGEVTRTISLSAYVLGIDYLDKREKLEKALNEKGAGTLIHPYYGSIHAALSAPISVSHTAQDGGMCVFSLEFVRVDTEKDANANASINEAKKAQIKSKKTLQLIGQALQELIQIQDFGDYVKNKVKGFAYGQLSKITQMIGISPLAIYSFAESFSSDEATIGHNYVSVLQESMSGVNPHTILTLGEEVQMVTVPEMLGSSQKAVQESEKAFAEATKQACVCLALNELASYIPATRTDAQILRENALILLDELAYNTNNINDEIFASLADLRVFAFRALFKNIGQSPDILMVKTASIKPSLALSYLYLGNLTAEKDMAARNSFEHPAFIPAGLSFEISPSNKE